ncbi:MAG: UDP-N-acetylmuramoyl-L-alanyl-D-glutamate--2,6-diaminopimelate ligase [Bdellovibrionaceae bacterium]|jgi:UDP-N-acetylmuramoyl-L-alanyl-D-glutamate--2,6-diaminopimelate ligase|nr:UDP-N-acetylmuramoyl-L-alanyl-D-glutamate--2,6-diaminopimelate ligase [Pseudobdellovibrionaceae bacterium]
MFSWDQLLAHLPESKVILPHPSIKPVGLCQGIATHRDHMREGYLFVAIRGQNYDGHKDLPGILNKKPWALIVQDPSQLPSKLEVCCLVYPYPRKAASWAYQLQAQEPSRQLFCLGVTGTNGKTSVTTMADYLLTRAGHKVARIGTIGVFSEGHKLPTTHTTPDASFLAPFLAEQVNKGVTHLAMEVSSHALDQYRVAGMHWNVACFTHLTRDHLDYHGTMENYFQAKAKLFQEGLRQSQKPRKKAVINADDKWAQRLLIPEGVQLIRYGQRQDADFRYQVISSTSKGLTIRLTQGAADASFLLNAAGEFQAANWVCALAALSDEIPWSEALSWAEQFPGVPGRMQRIPDWPVGDVFIDYAHTPDALEKALVTLKKLLPERHSRLFVVFGCGGNRDQGKRSVMGQVASKWADGIFLTNDNPRFEEPEVIIQQIVSGIEDRKKLLLLEPDRRKAIVSALQAMRSSDILLIAGKGHEDYQEIQGVKYPFSDEAVVRSQIPMSPHRNHS